jgi:hypothetical protein
MKKLETGKVLALNVLLVSADTQMQGFLKNMNTGSGGKEATKVKQTPGLLGPQDGERISPTSHNVQLN